MPALSTVHAEAPPNSLQEVQKAVSAPPEVCELCVYCLHHSDLDTAKTRECIKRNTQAHWLSCEARDPQAPPRVDTELPPVEQKAGRIPYACRTNIRVKTTADSRADSYSARLATLLDMKRQMSVIVTDAAIGRGLRYLKVPEVEVMLDDSRRELSNKLFMLEVRSYRATRPLRPLERLLVGAYGVTQAALAAVAAPELPLLRWRFGTKPCLPMKDLAQQAGPTELVLSKDSMQYWPTQVDRNRCAGDSLYLMKIQFHPG
jgi:hypothetical protein